MKFLLDVEGSLKYTFSREDSYIESILIDVNVLIFDYDKDGYNTIHLIYLKKDGNLNYVIIKDKEVSKSVIGKFDTKANSYNQISILKVNSKINIIYSYSNVINSNIYTLHHVVLANNIEQKNTIIRYVSKKKDISFMVDSDSSGNLHLFYNTISNNFSYIYYTYFNPFSNRWLSNPIKLSNSDSYSEYPSIYVDSYDNIHGTWWEKKSNMFLLRYTRMSSAGKEKFKWNDINIPTIAQEKPMSIISEEESILMIFGDLYSLKSYDYGLNWAKDEKKLVLDKPMVENLSSTRDVSNNKEFVEPKSLDKIDTQYEEKIDLEQIQLNQIELELYINNIMDDLLNLKSRVSTLEDNTKNTKSFFKRFFS